MSIIIKGCFRVSIQYYSVSTLINKYNIEADTERVVKISTQMNFHHRVRHHVITAAAETEQSSQHRDSSHHVITYTHSSADSRERERERERERQKQKYTAGTTEKRRFNDTEIK